MLSITRIYLDVSVHVVTVRTLVNETSDNQWLVMADDSFVPHFIVRA